MTVYPFVGGRTNATVRSVRDGIVTVALPSGTTMSCLTHEVELPCDCGGIDAVPEATYHQPDCASWERIDG